MPKRDRVLREPHRLPDMRPCVTLRRQAPRSLHAPGARRSEPSMPRSGARRSAIRGRVPTGLKRLPLHVLPSYHRAGCCRAGSALRHHRVDVPSRRHLGGRRVSRLVPRVSCLVSRAFTFALASALPSGLPFASWLFLPLARGSPVGRFCRASLWCAVWCAVWCVLPLGLVAALPCRSPDIGAVLGVPLRCHATPAGCRSTVLATRPYCRLHELPPLASRRLAEWPRCRTAVSRC